MPTQYQKLSVVKNSKPRSWLLFQILSPDKNNPYEWFDEIKDTTPFFRNYEKQKRKFEINFIDDSAAKITDEAGVNKATGK